MEKLSEEQWRSFSDRLGHSLELPEHERAPWLAALALTHPDVADEVQQALAVRARKGFDGFLSGSAISSAADPTLIGCGVGSHVIESEFGSSVRIRICSHGRGRRFRTSELATSPRPSTEHNQPNTSPMRS